MSIARRRTTCNFASARMTVQATPGSLPGPECVVACVCLAVATGVHRVAACVRPRAGRTRAGGAGSHGLIFVSDVVPIDASEVCPTRNSGGFRRRYDSA